MFPAGMFAKSYFAGTYFPPVDDVTPPTPDRRRRGGGRVSPVDWRLWDDEDVLLFLLQ